MELINNRYEIIASIGEGGMANVYLANDLLMNRQVAIKILRGEMANDPVALVRFQREANAATTLSHPNIVSIYDVGSQDNRHYIVMEYIKGQSLKQLLKRRGALQVDEAVYIMRQLTAAIQAAHQKGIIHRDIKPQNVLVTADGSIKITDFGIAMAQDALQLTVSDSVMGSVHYLAPELARGEVANVQCDIYSLGIVFYELLSGDVPFRAETPVQVAIKHLREEVPHIRDLNPNIPISIENIIFKATAKNKKSRYQNCEELMHDLLYYNKEEIKKVDDSKADLEDETEKTVVAPKIDKRTAKKMEKMAAKEKKAGANQEVDEFGYSLAKKKKDKYIKALIITLMACISIGAIVGILFISGIISLPKKKVDVPNLINMTQEQANKALTDIGLFLDPIVVREVTDATPKDQIAQQSPIAGTPVEEGTNIKVVVSDGIWVFMDDYVGKMIDAAKEDIVNKQLTNITVLVQNRVNNTVAEGTILEQTGLTVGFKIDPTKKYQVTFIVSGYLKVILPNVVDQDITVAQTQLKNLGINVKISQKKVPVDADGNELPGIVRGKVISMSPSANTNYTQDAKASVVLYYY